MNPKAFLVLFFLLLVFPALGCRKAPAQTKSTPDLALEPWNFGVKDSGYYHPPEGYVPDEETAVSIAVAVLTPIHGKPAIDAQKPFAAKLEKGIWKIKGQTVPDGGDPISVNISKDSGCISIPSKKIGKPATGCVPDGDTAIAIAVAAWNPIYGKKDIEEEKPYTAKFHDGHWYVEGSLPAGFNVGGTALAKISKDSGCIVGIIHGK